MTEQKCGNCKYFEPWIEGNKRGWCEAPVPDSAAALSVSMKSESGTRCPVFALKETRQEK